MKWTKQTVYNYYGGQLTGEEFDGVIKCSDAIYAHVPNDGTRYYLLEANLIGYDDLAEVREIMEDVLNFVPGSCDYFMISTAALNDDFFLSMMRLIGAQYVEADNVNMSYLDNNTGTGFVTAYNYFANGATDKIGTNSFYYTPMAFLGNDRCYLYDNSGNTHFAYQFDVYPEAMIESDVWNFDALQNGTDVDVNPNSRLYGTLTIDVWIDNIAHKWNMEIYVTGYNRNMGTFYDRYNGESFNEPVHDTENPTDNDPNNENQGGNGDGLPPNTPIAIPGLPTSDMTDAGSIRVYAPDKSDIKALFTYLHSANIGDNIYKLWQNPIQAIVSVHYLPYPLRWKSNTKVSIDMVGLPTGCTAYPAEQFQTLNFGWAYVSSTKRNCYLDRSPYTKVQLYLPGIGIRELNTDDVMGKYINVTYNCDNVSGQFVAFVLVSPSKNATVKDASVKYTYSGSCAAPFPISQNNWGQTYVAAATLAAGSLALGVGAAANGAAAAHGAAGAESLLATGVEAAGGSGAVATQAINTGSSSIALMKPTVARSGAVSGTTSLFGVRVPFLIVERPNVSDYSDFNKIKGYACGMTCKLGNLKGYTVIEKIHITGVPATKPEIEEIEALLKGGVII